LVRPSTDAEDKDVMEDPLDEAEFDEDVVGKERKLTVSNSRF
jgi:hypothetical protein